LIVEEFRGRPEEWDGFVRAQPGWSHCHLHGWSRLIQQVYPHDCIYLASREADGKIAGVLPLVRVRSLLFGHYLVSLPFLNYGGPLGSVSAVKALANHAAGIAEKQNVKLLELRSRFELDIDLPVSHRKITVLLDLPERDPDLLWRALPSKVRSQVRRPQKDGVSVRFGPDQVGPFYHVFARHMRDLGTPVQPRKLFDAINEVFPDDAQFGCAYLDGQPIAAGCGFRWGGEFEMTWASALVEFKHLSANMLLYWAFMERCINEGVRLFNFGRCTPNGGTHRFKQQWGSRDQPLWWYYRAAGARASTPSPDDGAYSMGPRIWRHLPLAVANTVGPHLVQYVP
jgi:FemAB-related protein (PEP-CTERM system-associated)